MVHEVLELCCFEWFQNEAFDTLYSISCFRAVLFRMVPKLTIQKWLLSCSFRAVLFRMVPKQLFDQLKTLFGFRAVLFRMVPKQKEC